ncbi:MAG TPA: ATP-binding protein, partial [Candidatus Lokiarchaeia archaeon]|nr:ATP-binding protein [Candidatus Lokiarchaeia archaeon]
ERPFDSLFRQLKQDQELLAQSAQECQQSNTELENFAYIASHDMQEPLRKVVSFMQLLQKRYASQLDKKANEFIDIAIDGGTRMRQMISDLLEYSRVGTRGNPFVQADLEVILNEVLSDLVLLIEENGATITHDPLPSLVVDPIQMHQLFLNLLTNALKFRKEESPVVHISAIAQGNNYLFSVQDNGIGIDMTQADRLFQLFQRLHGRGDYPGTGIGLAVCKKIVERHGGQIWVESELEKETTFYFTLPQSHIEVPKRE